MRSTRGSWKIAITRDSSATVNGQFTPFGPPAFSLPIKHAFRQLPESRYVGQLAFPGAQLAQNHLVIFDGSHLEVRKLLGPGDAGQGD